MGAGFREEMKRLNFKRVLILGIDGLDPNILERMMNSGELPNFSRLRSEGTFARLQTSIPPESPVAWTCAATGVNPGRHGLFDFIRRDARKYLPDLSILRPEKRRLLSLSAEAFAPASTAETFWDILSAQGKKVTVIRWPVTFPPQRVNGRLLSGLGTPDVAGTLGRYRFFTTLPLTANDPAPDRVTVVKWAGNAISTELPGPEIVALTGRKASAIPCHIEKEDESDSVTIRLATSEPFRLNVGEWSGWHAVKFPGGVSRGCPAVMQLYLASVSPELGLFVTAPQIDPQDPAYPISFPKEFARDLAQEIGCYATLGIPEDGQAVRHGRMPLSAFLASCNEITREREKMFESELRRFESGLLAIVFDTSDRIQHVFWAATDPKHPAYTPELAREFGGVIADHYKKMDAVLGRAMQAAHGDMAILVMSDHGFASFSYAVNLNTWLVQKGYMCLKEGAATGEPLFASVDWSRTKAYALGFCSLFLNVKGREREGIVAQPDEYRRVREEIVQALRSWRAPETGAQVVRNAYLRDEIYQGAYVDDAPDIIIGYSPPYRASWLTAIGAAPAGKVVEENTESWAGDHLVDAPCLPGAFLSNVKCNASNPRLVDIAPTVLRWLDAVVPAGMDGRPLL